MKVVISLMALSAQQHHAVERVEAVLYLVDVLVALVAQFHDEGQHLVVFGVVEWELAREHELVVQVGQVFHDDLVDLQVSLLASSLLVHHAYEVSEPVGLLVFLLVGVVEPVDVLSPDSCQ